MARDRFIRNRQLDKGKQAHRDAGIDHGAAVKYTWQQKNREHLALLADILSNDTLYPAMRGLFEGWVTNLQSNPLANLTGGRLALIDRVNAALKAVARGAPALPPKPFTERRPHCSRNPHRPCVPAWSADPSLLPKKPPKSTPQ